MKAILEFNLPEDAHDYNLATSSNAMFSTLWDYDQWLRSKIKYSDLSDTEHECYKDCRSKLNEFMTENKVELP